MKALRTLLLLGLAAFMPLAAGARKNPYEKMKEKSEQRYNRNKAKAQKRYENARDRANQRYSRALRRAWERYEKQAAHPLPKEEDIPPVVAPIDEPPVVIDRPIEVAPEVVPAPAPPAPQPEPIVAPEPEPLPVVVPEPQPAPQPVVEPEPEPIQTMTFACFGTPMTVRRPAAGVLSATDSESIATAWETMAASPEHEAMLADVLALRSGRRLCDWAYVMLVRDLANALYGAGTPDAELLQAYLLAQSGYVARLGITGDRLFAFFGTDHLIYNRGYLSDGPWSLYAISEQVPGDATDWHVAGAEMPGERPVSLYVGQLPDLSANPAGNRHLASKAYPAASGDVNESQNLMEFFSSYPTSRLGENHMTRWQQYANTPLSPAANALKERLGAAVAGKTPEQAVNILLNFVQTSLVYEYDDKVWGGDRAFFPDETLRYPYADCEDRAILFTRLVRDLLGLKTALVYYPGHLAAAVEFPEAVAGDYLTVDGRRFTIADPTYINAPLGASMPGMPPSAATAILL